MPHQGRSKAPVEEEIAVHRITNFLASSEVDFFDEPHDELEIENTGSAPDHGNHSSTSSPALQIFIGTPSGTKFSVEIGDDLEIGFVIQSTWGDFNPKLHKIHKGCTRICPQETFGSYGLQRHDLISITTRSTGGAKTGDLTAKIAKTISGKDLPWDRAIANVESMLQQATTAQREELEQASSDRILVKCVRQLAKELTLDLKDFFPGAKTTKTRQTNRPTLVIGDLTFFPMTFKYADNSDVQIGSNFRISDRGLYTVPPDDFDRINQEGKLLSPNELGILSFRQPDSTCKTQTTTVTFPAMDAAGHSIIIQGWIYQYGKKQITLAQTRNKDVVLPETATITGYAFRDQWNNHESTWADLISHPAKTILNFCRCRAMTCMPFGGELGVLTASHANRKGHPLFAFGHAFLHSTLASFCREAVQHRHQFMSTFGKDERTRNCQNCFRTCESYGCPRSRQFWMLQPLSPTITVSHLDAQDLGCGSKKMISLRLGIRGTLGNRCLPGLTSNSNGAFWAFHHRCRRPNYRRRWMVLTSNAEPCDDKDRLGLLEQNWTLIARLFKSTRDLSSSSASTRTSRYFDPSLLLPKSLFCDRGSVSRTPSKSMTLGLDQSARTQSSSFLRELTKRSSSTSSRSSRTLKMFKVSMRTSRRFRKQLDLSTPKQLNRSARRPSFVRTSKTPRHPSRRPSRKLSRIRPKALWPPSKRCCKLENAQHRAGNAPSHSTRMTPWRDEQIGCSHVIQRFCWVWRLTFCQGMQPLWIQWNILFTVQLCFRGLSTLLHYRSNSRIFAVQYLSCRLGSVWRRQTQITLFYAEFTMPHWLQYDISNMHFDWSFAALSHLPCPRVVSWHSHLWATHVGEATNPGPAEQSRSEDFYVCIANITKLRKHADEVHRLYASFPGITCLAETSADESAIQHFSRSCRWKSLEYHSGSPCGLRGKKYSPPRPEFGGVGIITSPKSRRPTSQLKLEEWCSTRYLETIVQARGFQILVVAMYLHPLADDIHNAKRDINEALMARAAERVGIWGGHAIIAGDLNVPPRTTTLWQFLSPRGWVEAHQHADETLGTPTMPTCRESTWNDTIFFSPSLAPAIREISTFRKFILPTHAPLVTALDLGGVPDTYTIWKTIQPIQLEQLQALREIQYDEFFVDAMCELGQDTSVPDEATMQGWSAAAEMAIHRALIYHDKTGLSKCQRGRGREPVYKNVPYPKGAKIARSGDFQPSTHIGNVPYCQIVKQIRRLDSISRMLKIFPSSIHPIVLDDWKAVRRAKGFKDGFAAWARSSLPHYPDVDLVHHLLEMLRTHERSVAQKIERQKKAKWTEALNISWKSRGNKLTHQVTSVRGNPFLTKACQTDYVTCLALRSRTKGGRLFRVPQDVAYHAQLSCDRGEIKWFDRQNGIFQIDPPISDASVQIKSTIWAHDPRDVHQAFFAYWSQFWDSDEPPGGEYISPDIIPDEWKIRHNVSLSVADFKAAVTHTRNDSAPGADGWRVLELQALCDTAIECWVQFINHTLQGRQGWPSSFS